MPITYTHVDFDGHPRYAFCFDISVVSRFGIRSPPRVEPHFWDFQASLS